MQSEDTILPEQTISPAETPPPVEQLLIHKDFFKAVRDWKKETASPFISFAGVIGVGKSTMAQKLAALLKSPLYAEKVEGNPELAAFYAEMTGPKKEDTDGVLKTAFPLQISLLASRLEQHEHINVGSAPGSFAIQDRSIFEDIIFVKILCAKGLMSQEHGALYVRLFSTVYKMLHQPSVLVYLKATPEVCYERILTRGRPMEKITFQYIQELCAGYDAFFEEMKGLIPVITVDYENHVDITGEEYTEMAEKLIEKIEEIVHSERAPSHFLNFNH